MFPRLIINTTQAFLIDTNGFYTFGQSIDFYSPIVAFYRLFIDGFQKHFQLRISRIQAFSDIFIHEIHIVFHIPGKIKRQYRHTVKRHIDDSVYPVIEIKNLRFITVYVIILGMVVIFHSLRVFLSKGCAYPHICRCSGLIKNTVVRADYPCRKNRMTIIQFQLTQYAVKSLFIAACNRHLEFVRLVYCRIFEIIKKRHI